MDTREGFQDIIDAFRQIKNVCQRVLTHYGRSDSQTIERFPVGLVKIDMSSNLKSEDLRSTASSEYPSIKKQKNISSRRKNNGQSRKKPKAPMTPYFLFFNQKREFIHSKYPHFSQSEMANVAGQIWRSLSIEQKLPYQVEYKKNKQIYAILINKFYQQNPEEIPSKQKRTHQSDRNDQQCKTEELQKISFSEQFLEGQQRGNQIKQEYDD